MVTPSRNDRYIERINNENVSLHHQIQEQQVLINNLRKENNLLESMNCENFNGLMIFMIMFFLSVFMLFCVCNSVTSPSSIYSYDMYNINITPYYTVVSFHMNNATHMF